MIKHIWFVLCAGVLLLTSCSDEKKEENNEQKESAEEQGDPNKEIEYVLVPEESTLLWKGTEKDHADDYHMGPISFVSGSATERGGKLVGGKAELDIRSIKATDLDDKPEKNDRLIGHLLNEDFFAEDSVTLNNPTVELLHMNEGGDVAHIALRVRGMMAEFDVPVTVSKEDGRLMISASEFGIDFMPFEIPYFLEGNMEESVQFSDLLLMFKPA